MVPARSDSVVQTVDQGSAVTSWNVAVPGELIRPGLRVLAEVGRYPVRQVCVTGGEPLAQKD